MNYSLKQWNTFQINIRAKNIVFAKNVEHLLNTWQNAIDNKQPVIILGDGSNVLFLDDFHGTVIINCIMGIKVTENNIAWFLHVGAGENWHRLVKFTLKNNMPGLENLALIPGRVGSSPIQNIGAYGAELKNFCQYVDCVELKTRDFRRLKAEECRFGYRDSIFKHEYQNKFVIIAIGLRLLKNWKPLLMYGDLMYLKSKIVTPKKIFNSVCRIRMHKLPNPRIKGNAGSFFKNPVILQYEYETFKKLFIKWPNIPHYLQSDGSIKLSASWLIDQCQLKDISYGGAAINRKQSLVLINKKNATGGDIIHLAYIIRKCVGEKFNFWLEPEVRFIGSTGEISALSVFDLYCNKTV